MKAFHKIYQFHNVIKSIKYDHQEEKIYPTITFIGTVKIHGTNAAIVKYIDGHFEFQSRGRILSLDNDNYDFMSNMINKPYSYLFNDIIYKEYCVIYGEWCGEKIQKKMGISLCSKMFVIFAIKIDDKYIMLPSKLGYDLSTSQIYNINQFDTFRINIDFNSLQDAQCKLQKFTRKIEKECPIAKKFGYEGIGEGIVWESFHKNYHYVFKVKGKKHLPSKISKIASVDPEITNTLNQFIDYSVTENRLRQGVIKMIELNGNPSKKHTGCYIKWIINDILDEEKDVIKKSNIDLKKIRKCISRKASIYWLHIIIPYTFLEAANSETLSPTSFSLTNKLNISEI